MKIALAKQIGKFMLCPVAYRSSARNVNGRRVAKFPVAVSVTTIKSRMIMNKT